MGAYRYYKNKKENPIKYINREKHLLLKHFDFLNCEVKGRKLHCYGTFQPSSHSVNYKYKIVYNGSNSPRSYIIHPEIEYNDDIHMFPKDNALCLYHKSDMLWSNKYHIFNTIVPWTHEWIVFYELYCITGRWEHPFVAHKGIKTE